MSTTIPGVLMWLVASALFFYVRPLHLREVKISRGTNRSTSSTFIVGIEICSIAVGESPAAGYGAVLLSPGTGYVSAG